MDHYIIVYGNPVDGLQFIGPFDSEHEAIEYATNKQIPKPWWIKIIDRPAVA